MLFHILEHQETVNIKIQLYLFLVKKINYDIIFIESSDVMKKKGFTLIELLAVIVILAVIALISVPILLNVISTSKLGAIKNSANGILSAADVYLASNLKNGIDGTKQSQSLS